MLPLRRRAPSSAPAACCPLSVAYSWYPCHMKRGMRSIKDTVASKTAKDALIGTGLFGAGEIAGACALGCLLIWLALAVVIVLLWVVVALIAAALPL